MRLSIFSLLPGSTTFWLFLTGSFNGSEERATLFPCAHLRIFLQMAVSFLSSGVWLLLQVTFPSADARDAFHLSKAGTILRMEASHAWMCFTQCSAIPCTSAKKSVSCVVMTCDQYSPSLHSCAAVPHFVHSCPFSPEYLTFQVCRIHKLP